MRFINVIKEQYSSVVSDIEDYNEPYRTRAIRWINVGKAALVIGAVDMIGTSTTNMILGFEQHQAALQHTLEHVQVYGFAGSVALGLATVAGIGSAERQSRVSE